MKLKKITREVLMERTDKNDSRKRGLRLVEKYDNDDYSRYAGPDYKEEADFEQSAHNNKQEITLRPKGNWEHPGVSGKADSGKTWVNDSEYKDQTGFVGHGPKGYKRSDDRIYEEVCETLMKDREVDARNIGVRVETGVVYLTGKVSSRRMKKIAEIIIEDLPGVQDVRNELSIFKGDDDNSGPHAPTGKDLGLY
jgi:osmotically-inducible protein OsmY